MRRTVCVWPLLRLLSWLSNHQHFLLPEWQKSGRTVCEEDLDLFNYGLFWGKNRKLHRGSKRGFKGSCSGFLRSELPRLLPEMCPSVYSVSLPQWACATFQTGGTSGKTVCKFEAHLKFVTLSVCCSWFTTEDAPCVNKLKFDLNVVVYCVLLINTLNVIYESPVSEWPPRL